MSYNFDASEELQGVILLVLFFVGLWGFVALVSFILTGVGFTAMFKKYGHKNPWAAWVPVYRDWVFCEVSGQKGWWGLLPFIPVIIAPMIAFGILATILFAFISVSVIIFGYVTFIRGTWQVNKDFGKGTVLWEIFAILLTPVWAIALGVGKHHHLRPMLSKAPETGSSALPSRPKKPVPVPFSPRITKSEHKSPFTAPSQPKTSPKLPTRPKQHTTTEEDAENFTF